MSRLLAFKLDVTDRASSLIRGNKRSTRCNRWFFIAKLIVRSTCFGHT